MSAGGRVLVQRGLQMRKVDSGAGREGSSFHSRKVQENSWGRIIMLVTRSRAETTAGKRLEEYFAAKTKSLVRFVYVRALYAAPGFSAAVDRLNRHRPTHAASTLR